jgi:1,4-alpha-glucan branching enzyme
MSVQKEYLTDKRVCKVKFILPQEIANSAKKASLVGDFNNWDHKQAPMQKRSNGTRSVSIELPTGKEYQFRYFIDETRWENENEADKQVVSPFQDTENSVIVI